MDPDITAAATSLDLDKIQAQDYRNELKSIQADRAARTALETTRLQAYQTSLTAQEADRVLRTAALTQFRDWAQAEILKLPAENPRLDLFMRLAEKYMTPSTATVQATIDADSANDALRLDAAFKAASPLLP